MSVSARRSRQGFTLLELIVVVAILALLAGMVLPTFTDTVERNKATVAANNLTDTARAIDEHFSTNGVYPDGWDTLIGTTDATGSPSGTALFTKIVQNAGVDGELPDADMLTTATVATADPSLALLRTKVNTFYYHIEGLPTNTMPNDATSQPGQFGVAAYDPVALTPTSGARFAVMNPVATSGNDGNDAYLTLRTEFNLSPTYIAEHNFIALGVGKRNNMVGNSLQTPATVDVHDVGAYYSRVVAIFAVPNASGSTEKARFVGVLGPDGKTVSRYLSDYYRLTVSN